MHSGSPGGLNDADTVPGPTASTLPDPIYRLHPLVVSVTLTCLHSQLELDELELDELLELDEDSDELEDEDELELDDDDDEELDEWLDELDELAELEELDWLDELLLDELLLDDPPQKTAST